MYRELHSFFFGVGQFGSIFRIERREKKNVKIRESREKIFGCCLLLFFFYLIDRGLNLIALVAITGSQ